MTRRRQDGIARLGFVPAYADLMQAVAAPGAHLRMLDVETGTGAFASAWMDTHGNPAHLMLMDISQAMLDSASLRLPNASPR